MSTPSEGNRRRVRKLRPLFWALGLLAALAGLAASLPLLADRFVGPERLRDMVRTALTQALGREVTIGGKVRLTGLPLPGLVLEDLSVADAEGFPGPPVLTAREVALTIRLVPLLGKVIAPGPITLTGPRLTLKRDASGRGNWEDLPDLAEDSTEIPGWRVLPAPTGIRLRDGAVEYGETGGGHAAIDHIQLKTGAGRNFSFSLSFSASDTTSGRNGEFHATGRAFIDPDTGNLGLGQAVVEAVVTAPRKGGPEPWRFLFRAGAKGDLAGRSLELSDIEARGPDMTLSGRATLSGAGRTPRLSGKVRLAAEPDGDWLILAGLYPDGGERLVRGDRGDGAALRTFPEGPRQAVLETAFEADRERLAVSDLRLVSAAARIDGWAVLRPGPAPSLAFGLVGRDLDVDPWPWPSGGGPLFVPPDILAALSLDGRIAAHDCVLSGTRLPEVFLTLTGRDGRFRLEPASLTLPGGLLTLSGAAEAAPGRMSLAAGVEFVPAGGAGPDGPPAFARLTSEMAASGVTGRVTFGGLTETVLAALSGERARPEGREADRAADPLAPERGVTASNPLQKSFPRPLAPSRGAASFRAAPNGSGDIERLEWTDLDLDLAGQAVAGQASWTPGASPPWRFDLSLAGPPPLPVAGGESQGGAGAEAGAGLPVAAGRIRIERATLAGLDFRNLAAEVETRPGRLEVTALAGEAAGGRLSGKGSADLASGRLSLSAALGGVDAQRLTGIKGLGGAVGIKVEAQAAGTSLPSILSTLSGRVEAELPRGRLDDKTALTRARVEATLKGHEPSGGRAGLEADFKAAAETLGQARDLAGSFKTVLRFEPDGTLSAIEPARFEAALLVPTAGKGQDRAEKLTLGGTLRPDPASGAFSATDVALALGPLRGSGSLTRKGREEGGAYAGSLVLPDFAPRPVLAALGVAVPPEVPPELLARAQASLQLSGTDSRLEIKKLHIRCDDVELTGQGVMAGLSAAKGKWDLSVDRLDLDRYFPPKAPAPHEKGERDQPIDLDALRAAAADLKVRFHWLRQGRLIFEDAVLTLKALGGQIGGEFDAGRAYGGRFRAGLKADARDKVLKVSAEIRLDGFDGAVFMREWADGDTLDAGALTFNLALRGSGASEAAIRANLAGNANFQVTRGRLKVSDESQPATPTGPAAGEAEGGTASLRAPRKPAAPHQEETIPFDVFSSSFAVREGVGYTEDFRIEGPTLKVSGKGVVDLRQETIRLDIMARLRSGAEVPALIVGPLDDPRLEVDRARMVGDMLFRAVKDLFTLPGRAIGRVLSPR